MSRRLFILMFAVWLVGSMSFAGTVAVWRHSSKADFEKAELDGIVLGRDGEVTLGRQVKLLADLKCGSVWDLVRNPQGRMFAVTALPGQLVEFTAEGTTKTLWSDKTQQAFSLAALPDGSLLVGTGPAGMIYRVQADGKASEFYKTGAMYVWDLLVDARGVVFAATGPKGEIHRIEADGQGRAFYQSRQEHVLTLAQASDGTLLAGTDGAGLVLAVDAAGRGRVLYDSAEGEVRALWNAADGAVYVGTAAGAASMTSGMSGSSSSGSSSSATNGIYRVDTAGGIRRLFSAKSMIYSLAMAESAEPLLLAGTGSEGWLYQLDDSGRGERQLARIDAELLLAMLPCKTGEVILASGNPGRLYVVSAAHQPSGTLTSAPLDAKLGAKFGALNWRAELEPGAQVSLAVRSGNTQVPDESWSQWSVEQTDPATAKAECPPGRFLQYRLTLRTNQPRSTPVVRAVSVRYLTANQPPSITKLTVPHVEEGDGKKVQDKLKLTWVCADPNQDELVYRLRFRKLDWKTWVTLKDDLTASEYEWDVTSVPEGIYQVELSASDRRSNSAAECLTATSLSEPMAVDRQGPRVEARLQAISPQQTATLEASANDTISPLVAAAYSLDSDTWVNLFPADGLFDSLQERFRWELPKLAPGTHVLVLRVTDAAGQTSSDDLVFDVK